VDSTRRLEAGEDGECALSGREHAGQADSRVGVVASQPGIAARYRMLLTRSSPNPSARRRRAGKISWDHLHFLLIHLHEKDPTLYLDEMVQLLEDKFGTRYKTTTICVTLIRMGISRRVLSKVNSNRCAQERDMYRAILANMLVSQLVFIDETRKDPRTLDRRYGRQFRGSRIQIPTNWSRSARGYSALGVMTINGMIDCAITHVSGVDRELFIEDLKYHVLPHLSAYPGPNSVLILDNASIHHSEDVMNLIESVGARIVFLPTYSYDLNPIELAFSKVKAWLQRHRSLCARDPYLAMKTAMESVTAEDARGYFRKCGYV
jgi:hypothetical protein